MDVTKNPLILFLAGVISAFISGAGLMMFLDVRIDDRVDKKLEATGFIDLKPELKGIRKDLADFKIKSITLHKCPAETPLFNCKCPDGFKRAPTTQDEGLPATNAGAEMSAILLCVK